MKQNLNLAVTLKKYGVHKRHISSLKSMTAKRQSCHLRSFDVGQLSKILSDIPTYPVWWFWNAQTQKLKLEKPNITRLQFNRNL